jgi:hypothetical protein
MIALKWAVSVAIGALVLGVCFREPRMLSTALAQALSVESAWQACPVLAQIVSYVVLACLYGWLVLRGADNNVPVDRANEEEGLG